MQFQEIFREERYYCNHFFRLLCEKLTESPKSSGLAYILKQLEIKDLSEKDIQRAEIYTEVAAFRDVFAKTNDKDEFLEKLFDLLLPLILTQYPNLNQQPTRPAEIKKRLGQIHPSRYKDVISEPEFVKSDVLVYREFGALFNAKPDFLILISNYALWIEAKYTSEFSHSQIMRMQTIGYLCSTPLFEKYFIRRSPSIILLGSNKRHNKAQKFKNTMFLSWEKCAEIAINVFNSGADDITSRAFRNISISQAAAPDAGN